MSESQIEEIECKENEGSPKNQNAVVMMKEENKEENKEERDESMSGTKLEEVIPTTFETPVALTRFETLQLEPLHQEKDVKDEKIDESTLKSEGDLPTNSKDSFKTPVKQDTARLETEDEHEKGPSAEINDIPSLNLCSLDQKLSKVDNSNEKNDQDKEKKKLKLQERYKALKTRLLSVNEENEQQRQQVHDLEAQLDLLRQQYAHLQQSVNGNPFAILFPQMQARHNEMVNDPKRPALSPGIKYNEDYRAGATRVNVIGPSFPMRYIIINWGCVSAPYPGWIRQWCMNMINAVDMGTLFGHHQVPHVDRGGSVVRIDFDDIPFCDDIIFYAQRIHFRLINEMLYSARGAIRGDEIIVYFACYDRKIGRFQWNG